HPPRGSRGSGGQGVNLAIVRDRENQTGSHPWLHFQLKRPRRATAAAVFVCKLRLCPPFDSAAARLRSGRTVQGQVDPFVLSVAAQRRTRGAAMDGCNFEERGSRRTMRAAKSWSRPERDL